MLDSGGLVPCPEKNLSGVPWMAELGNPTISGKLVNLGAGQ